MPGSFSETLLRTDELVEDSLVKKLLDMKDNFELNRKSIEWLQDLRCLSVPQDCQDGRTSIRLLRLPGFWTDTLRDYVALSYSWHTMAGEGLDHGGYMIESTSQPSRNSRIRDAVLYRTLRYARHVGCQYVWADQECIDHPKETEKAIASMDVVYRKSRYPVGLLATVLSQMDDIKLLRELVLGKFAFETDQKIKLRLKHDDGKIPRLLALLQRLSQDLWWKRAWIFQEDYLGEPRMTLLIPYRPQLNSPIGDLLSRSSNAQLLWATEGDVCINASAFRRCATIFLLALKRESPGIYGTECQTLLDVFGKYNVLYRHDEKAKGRAMSSKIFADLSKRIFTNDDDFLPIAANACDYNIRPNSDKMAGTTSTLGTRGLAMYLLNGEIIANNKEFMNLPIDTRAHLSQYLDDISFNAFDPPVSDRELTWLKDCRFSDVTLSEDGIHTTGHMWRVYAQFKCTEWMLSAPSNISQEEWQDLRLNQLAEKLQRAANREKIPQSHLPTRLMEYLETFRSSRKPTAAMQHMYLMANEVVHAIDSEQIHWLSLATLEGSSGNACAVFVGDHCNGSLVFTSWFSGMDGDDRFRTRHVNLKVRAEASEKNGDQEVLRMTDWVNGLVLFEQRKDTQKEVIFAWPRMWTQPTREPVRDLKRKRRNEDQIGDNRHARTDSTNTV
jgi:hypothetical protein